MSQTSFWQTDLQSKDFAELCNALYERELRMLANTEISQVDNLQGAFEEPTALYKSYCSFNDAGKSTR